MTGRSRLVEHKCHRKMAAELFNLVWKLLGKKKRTKDEDDRMVHAAHASRFHWGEVRTAVKLARGEWQISRVYSVLRRPQPAIYHAERCLQICKTNALGDFDLAFAYEAMARAYAVAGSKARRNKYIDLGEQAGADINEKEDKALLLSDLETIPR